MCNGLISATVGLSATKMCSDRREWVAEAVANGSRRLGCRTVANGLPMPSQMVRDDWVAGPSRMVLPDRRNWLSATVRLDGDWVWE